MKFRHNKLLLGVILSGIFSSALLSSNAYAIPAFTRANNVECSTCHTIFPELNEYGEAFLKNSYVYFGKGKKKSADKGKLAQASVEAKPMTTSVAGGSAVKGEGNADLLSKLKSGVMTSAEDSTPPIPAVQPADAADTHATAVAETKLEGIALSGVPDQLPISFTASLNGTYNNDAVNDFDFSTRALKLNAGGNFREKAGFFGTYLVYTESPVANNANTSTIPTNLLGKNDIGELFLIWRHALDTPVNIKIGRFQPKLGLWKSNNRLSITNSYATYAYTVGESLFRLEQPQDAIEANMIVANRLFVAAGAVNRKNQNTKEWYVHSSVKIGGADYLVNEPEIDLNKEESVFDFLTLTVGGYAYFGTNGDPNTNAGVTVRQNDYYRTGVDVDLLYKLFRLKMSGIVGNDNNADLTNAKPDVKSYVAATEIQYTILQNLITSLRFEYQDDGSTLTRRFIPTVAYAPIENVKIAAEYKREYGSIERRIGTLGVTFSF